MTAAPRAPRCVHLDDGETLTVDAVVLTLGHLDVDPSSAHAADADFAARHGLAHLPPAYTADIDLDAFEPGEPVIVRGLGLAFIDVMVLLTEGRGGRFVDDGEGSLRYEPSGREPVLLAGSRRGVPYRSKIGYRLQAPRPSQPRFLDNAAVASIVAEHDRIDFRTHLWPLLGKDVLWGYYHELFHAHPERTAMTWDDFDAALARRAVGRRGLDQLVAAAVPDRRRPARPRRPRPPARRPALRHPDDLQHHLRTHIEADRARRADPAFSADLGAFYALLVGFGQVVQVLGSGRMTPRTVAEDVNGRWYSFFSYYASGPPAARLDQLLALSRAGIVQFLGADLRVTADEQAGCFRAGSTSVDGDVTARALIDARLPAASVSRTRSPLLRALRDRGEATEQVLVDDGGRHPHQHGQARRRPGPPAPRRRRRRPPEAVRPRHPHQPPGGRHVRSPPHQRPAVPAERRRRPFGAPGPGRRPGRDRCRRPRRRRRGNGVTMDG